MTHKVFSLPITHLLFKVHTPDFARKFIWIMRKELATMQRKICMESMQKNSMNHGTSYNSEFCMKVCMDHPSRKIGGEDFFKSEQGGGGFFRHEIER